jgi:acetyltransferase-like isoleucine patch superfamily enzyme
MSKSGRSAFSKVRRFIGLALPAKLNFLQLMFYRLKAVLYYRHVFASFGSGSVIYKPMLIGNPEFMHIGDNVVIRQGARLEAILTDQSRPPELRIGNNVNIEQNVHIVCHSKVVIGNDVSITGQCAIVDVTHPFDDIRDPVKIGERILTERSIVEIGDRSFLGFGATVLPNVHLGQYCVVGAHSLVTKDVPDYSVVAGNPARVLRHYDAAKGGWAPGL